MTEWRIGDYRVTLVEDGVLHAGADILFHPGGETALAAAKRQLPDGQAHVVVNLFLIEGPEGVILIDTGMGRGGPSSLGQAPARLAEKGIRPEDVDHILLTHFHTDHAAGLIDGEQAFYPRARVHYPAGDLAFFTDLAARDRLPEARRAAFALTARVLAICKSQLAPYGRDAGLPFEAVALPGHTPGHTGYLLKSDDASLLVWGDIMHLKAMQAADPDLGVVFDIDAGQARATRHHILAEAASRNWVVAGSHIEGFNRFTREGTGFIVQPA